MWRDDAEDYIKELFDRFDMQVKPLIHMGVRTIVPQIKQILWFFWHGQLHIEDLMWVILNIELNESTD